VYKNRLRFRGPRFGSELGGDFWGKHEMVGLRNHFLSPRDRLTYYDEIGLGSLDYQSIV